MVQLSIPILVFGHKRAPLKSSNFFNSKREPSSQFPAPNFDFAAPIAILSNHGFNTLLKEIFEATKTNAKVS